MEIEKELQDQFNEYLKGKDITVHSFRMYEGIWFFYG